MSRSAIITLVLLFLVLCMVAVFTWYTQQKAAEQEKTESAAGVAFDETNNAFTSLSGESVSLNSFDELTVAYVWASWCPQCQTELEALSRIADTYESENTAVRFVAINRREPASTVERFLAQVDYSDSLNIVLDTTDNFYASIEAYAMPELVLFDTNGDEILRQRGQIDFGALEAAVDTELDNLSE